MRSLVESLPNGALIKGDPMRVSFSVADYPPADRVDALREALSTSLAAVAVDVAGVGIRSAKLTCRDVGVIRAYTAGGPAGPVIEVSRTRRLVSAAPDASLLLTVPLSGSYVIRQDDRDARVRPGNVVCHDSSRAHSAVFDRNYSLALVRVPHSALGVAPKLLDRAGAVPISSRDGVGRLFRPLLTGLVIDVDSFLGPCQRDLSLATIELIRALLVERFSEPFNARSLNTILREEILRFIDNNFPDPRLTPQTVAAAHSISIRQLHRVFAEAGTTFSACVRNCRLRAAARELRNPRAAHRSIESVAASCGFSSPAHFSRLFKSVFGMGPRQWKSSG